MGLALVLGGCFKVEVYDSRLTREEVQRAFAERDKALGALATRMIELQKTPNEKSID